MKHLHVIEFWPYLTGLNPKDIAIKQTGFFASLDKTAALPARLRRAELVGVSDNISDDVEKTWQAGVAKNPQLTNNLKPCMRSISSDGRVVRTMVSDYKSAFWIKTKLCNYSYEGQDAIARQFPFLNVGLVAVTSDNKILIERRPEGFTANGMLLNYPAGHANPEHKTLADVVNSQCEGELGFGAFDRQGSYSKQVKRIYSIGMQRESCEWTPSYAFVMELTVPFDAIKPTKETKYISALLPADADMLADKVVELYSPTIKGDVAGKLVPNAAGILSLYIKAIAGKSAYVHLLDKLAVKAEKHNYTLEVVEYNAATSPFAEPNQ